MTVSIDLTIAAKTKVLTVPSNVVRAAATAAPWVQIVVDGRAVRRSVKLGIRGEGATEVESGISEGAEVIVPDGQRLEEGARVRTERG